MSDLEWVMVPRVPTQGMARAAKGQHGGISVWKAASVPDAAR